MNPGDRIEVRFATNTQPGVFVRWTTEKTYIEPGKWVVVEVQGKEIKMPSYAVFPRTTP